VEAEKFSLLANRLLELRSQTPLANADKTEMKNIIRSLNDSYSEYLGNINLETSSYNSLATALRNASDALVQKKIAEVYGEKYNAQIRKVAELQIQIDSHQAEVDRVRARKQQLMNSVDWEFLTSDRNAMGFNPATYFGNDGEWNKLERRLNQFSALHSQLRDAKNDLQQIGSAYRQAMLDAPDLSFTPNTNTGAEFDERQRKLEQLAQLQQRYDTLAIDDLVARKQKELEIERDNELAKAQSLGASETLLQSIRDHYADESVRVASEAADARTKKLEAEAQEAKRIAEATAREQQRLAEEEQRRQEELADTRYEFVNRGLELIGNTYDAELRAIDQYYAKRREKLLAAGFTEQQITQQTEMAKSRIRDQYDQKHFEGVSQMLGNLAKATEVFGRKGFALWKTLAVAQAMMDTYSSATAAYKAMVGIPVVGPGLAVAAAAAAVAAGLANVAVISNTEPPKAATGGMLVGRSHSQGGILIEAEGEEYITAKDRVKALGRNLFDFLNFAPIESVKLAFAGMPVPSVPIPANIGSYYGSGGSIMSGGSINSIMDTIVSVVREEFNSLRQSISDNKPNIEVNVDPLSNDPVKVSQIADKGKLIRSEV